MKKFRFRLGKVLRVKELKEKEKMKEVAKVNGKIQSLGKGLKEANNLLVGLMEKISIQRQGNANGIDLKQSLTYHERINKELNEFENRIELANHELNEKRKELSKINRDKRVIETLKEIKLEQFNKEILAREQLENDEIAQRKSRIVFPLTQTIKEKIARA